MKSVHSSYDIDVAAPFAKIETMHRFVKQHLLFCSGTFPKIRIVKNFRQIVKTLKPGNSCGDSPRPHTFQDTNISFGEISAKFADLFITYLLYPSANLARGGG